MMLNGIAKLRGIIDLSKTEPAKGHYLAMGASIPPMIPEKKAAIAQLNELISKQEIGCDKYFELIEYLEKPENQILKRLSKEDDR